MLKQGLISVFFFNFFIGFDAVGAVIRWLHVDNDYRELSSFFHNNFVYIVTTFNCADDFPTRLQLFGVLILSLSSLSTKISYCQALTASNSGTCKQTRHSGPTCQLLGVFLREGERVQALQVQMISWNELTAHFMFICQPVIYSRVPVSSWNHLLC